MFSDHGPKLASSDVGPRQEIVDLAVWAAVDDPGKHVSKVAERLDIVQLARLDQRSDDGPVLGAAVRGREESILAVERDRTDRALDHIVTDLDAAVVDEARSLDLYSDLKNLFVAGFIGSPPMNFLNAVRAID